MTVEYEKQGNVGIITINRPDARNAVNSDVAQGIESAIDQIEADDEVWVGILTGARTEKGYIFCAGADLKQMATDPGGMSTAKGGFGGFVQRERTKPIIAAVDGPALAGGTELVLAADLVVASRDRRVRHPRGQAQPGRRCRRPVPAAPQAPPQHRHGAGPHRPPRLPRRAGLPLRPGSTACARRARRSRPPRPSPRRSRENAPLAVRESRKIVLEATDQPDDIGWKLLG